MNKWLASTTYNQSVSEGEAVGFLVFTASASDSDSPDTSDGQVTYSVVVGASPDFLLDSETGQIILARELDRETTDQYIIEVEASDGSLSATATITIDVTDVNDNAPIFNPGLYR